MKKVRNSILVFIITLSLLIVAPSFYHSSSSTPALGIIEAQAAAKIKINKTKATIIKGKTLQLKIKGTKKKVTWKSSNKKIATVSKKGKVTAKKVGKVNITAKVGTKKFTCKVTVKDTVKGVNFTKLKRYINNNGKIDKKGNRYICTTNTITEDGVSTDYYTEISFVDGKLWFTEIIDHSDTDGYAITLFTVKKYSDKAYVYFAYCPENGDQDEEFEADFNAASYNYTQLYFDMIDVSDYVEDNYYSYNDWCNANLRVAMDEADELLQTIGFYINDFGFYNYAT